MWLYFARTTLSQLGWLSVVEFESSLILSKTCRLHGTRDFWYLASIYTLSLQEEAAREQKAKEDEAANEEFDKWKSAFVVDTEGTVENDVQEESQGLLFDFVEYIKVVIQASSSYFRMRINLWDWSLAGLCAVCWSKSTAFFGRYFWFCYKSLSIELW